jgi:hypothetical protein
MDGQDVPTSPSRQRAAAATGNAAPAPPWAQAAPSGHGKGAAAAATTWQRPASQPPAEGKSGKPAGPAWLNS